MNVSSILLTLTLVPILAMGCGSGEAHDAASAAARPESAADLATALNAVRGQQHTMLVLRDEENIYWALPASGIANVEKRGSSTRVTLVAGTLIGVGGGKGTPAGIAEIVLARRRSGGPFFMTVTNEGTANETSVSGHVGGAKAGSTIDAKELVVVESD
jgi:hypothetical protein